MEHWECPNEADCLCARCRIINYCCNPGDDGNPCEGCDGTEPTTMCDPFADEEATDE